MNNFSKMRRFFSSKWISILATIITIVSFSLALYMQLKPDTYTISVDTTDKYKNALEKYIVYINNESNTERESFKELYTRLQKIGSDSTKYLNDKEIQKINEVRFSEIENNVKKQSEYITALREAINPLNPDEVLTIARLKDAVFDLSKKVSEMETNIAIRQQIFEDSIKREMTSSNNSTTLILVVLIPLVLNFLYTVWKDFRKTDKEKNETKKMPNA